MATRWARAGCLYAKYLAGTSSRTKAAGYSCAIWKGLPSGAFGIVAEHSGGDFVLYLLK